MKAHPTVSDLEHAAEMNPNLDVIAGLRDVADWLSDHPELPAVWFSMINFDYPADEPRLQLVRIAEALGERATEETMVGDVVIGGTFLGNVRIQCRVPISKLTDEPVPPRYEPILKLEPFSVPVDESDFDV